MLLRRVCFAIFFFSRFFFPSSLIFFPIICRPFGLYNGQLVCSAFMMWHYFPLQLDLSTRLVAVSDDAANQTTLTWQVNLTLNPHKVGAYFHFLQFCYARSKMTTHFFFFTLWNRPWREIRTFLSRLVCYLPVYLVWELLLLLLLSVVWWNVANDLRA